MKIKLSQTSQITHLNGVPARIWEGETENGVPIVCFITRVAVRDDKDSSELERELLAEVPPKPVQSWPLSMIL